MDNEPLPTHPPASETLPVKFQALIHPHPDAPVVKEEPVQEAPSPVQTHPPPSPQIPFAPPHPFQLPPLGTGFIVPKGELIALVCGMYLLGGVTGYMLSGVFSKPPCKAA